MKKTSNYLIRIATIAGFALGAFALAAAANWVPPINTAPDCTTGNPGCDAPINVSNSSQAKKGALSVGTTTLPAAAYILDADGYGFFRGLGVLGNFVVKDGNQGDGKVLMSDANGLATWRTLASGTGGKIIFGGYQSVPLPNVNAITTFTLASISVNSTGLIAFIESNNNCADVQEAWAFYNMNNPAKAVSKAGARVGGGEEVSAQSFQTILPVVNKQFKYITGGACSGTLTVVGEIIP